MASNAQFVQIAVAMAQEQHGNSGGPCLYALDSEGNVWQYDRSGLSDAKWYRLNIERAS